MPADVIRPLRPRPGAGVGLVTPASSIAAFPRRTARAIHELERLGFVARPAPNAFWSDDAKPSPRELAADIEWCCRQDDIDVILCTTGGTTSEEVLRFLDFDLLAASRKVICGFSDITALLVGIHTRTGLVTFSGPTLVPSFGDADGVDSYTADSFVAALRPETGGRFHPPARSSTDSPWWDLEDHRPRISTEAGPWTGFGGGTVTGRLLGGHLETICSLLASGHLPSAESAVLFLESNHERVADIRTELTQLAAAGVFDQARGLVFGRPLDLDHPESLYGELERLSADHDLAVLADVDLGHTVPLLTVPIGVLATLSADDCSIVTTEPAVDPR